MPSLATTLLGSVVCAVLCSAVLALPAPALDSSSTVAATLGTESVSRSALTMPPTAVVPTATPVSTSLFSYTLSALPSTSSAGGDNTISVPFETTDAPAPTAPNSIAFPPTFTGTPEATRGTLGSTILSNQDVQIEDQNPDLLAPPTTDAGTIPNVKWPFALSHNFLATGGWARQQNIQNLGIATEMAGVNMRLEKGAIRELHWHTQSEWAYVIKGSVQITSVDQLGRNFVGTCNPGDLWFFPPGIPHSLQATNATDDGAEFLLVFDDGAASEFTTFLLTDWLAHIPKEVIAKNFQTSISAWDNLPGKQLYIFPAPPPGPDSDRPSDPQGEIPTPYVFAASQVQPTQYSGGSVKIVDSHTFNISKTTAMAEVTVEPGAMRELHWHPTQDEWTFFLDGTARVTLFAAEGTANTFDFQAGDVGYIPAAYGHYVENTGNDTLRFLEIFKTDTFQDVSLSQWLALTPPTLVMETLNIDEETLSHFSKTKPVVVGPPKNGTSA